MPKTVAYLLLVYVGFKNYVKEFRVQSLIELSFASLILGLVGGVFYREFTKVYGFTDSTYLGKVHVHALVLGFLSLLVFYSIVFRSNKKDLTKSLRRPIYLWVSGLLLSIVMMMIHGIIEVTGNYYGSIPEAAISGIAGMGHILLSAGIVWSMLILSREDVKNS